MKMETLKQQILTAKGDVRAELVLKNARVINVFTNEIEQADVAIRQGVILGVGHYTGETELDLQGKYVCPGLVDGHIHIESSMLCGPAFEQAVLPHGTTAVVTDPHEISNVAGTAGLDFMLETTKDLALSVYFMLPSCVPATGLDESGAVLEAEQLRPYYQQPRVLGLAELMNSYGTVRADEKILQKICDCTAAGKRIDGHAPFLSGEELNAYVTAGVQSDHECSDIHEAMEKLRRGQYIMVREGTAAQNMESLLPLFREPYCSRCMLVTDDKHPGDLLQGGHIDYIIRKAIAAAVQLCRQKGYASILLPEPALARLPGGRERLVEECVCAAQLALYRFSALKKADKDDPADPQWLALGFDGEEVPDASHAAARRGENAAWAVGMARDLSSTPPNLLYPEKLAERAQELARQKGFACTVLDEHALEKEGMGCLMAVGQGSGRPPRLVIIEYAPKGHEQDKPLILVGKGITFDTGGISLKPAPNMHQMKADMTGAATVLAAVAALAQEEAPRRVIGLLACAENMPGGRAMRPGDVVRAANGDTVEIQNTDAEGRLALCDALAYAQKNFRKAWGPEVMAKHPFKSPLYPYSNYFCIIFLILVTIGMIYNPDTRMSIFSSWVYIAAVVIAWFAWAIMAAICAMVVLIRARACSPCLACRSV